VRLYGLARFFAQARKRENARQKIDGKKCDRHQDRGECDREKRTHYFAEKQVAKFAEKGYGKNGE